MVEGKWTQQKREVMSDLLALGEMLERRDRIVVKAACYGINKHQIHMITGLSRTTIDVIIAKSENLL